MQNLTLKLIKPVTVDNLDYDSLTLNELTVDESISLNKQHGGKTLLEQDKYFFAMSCNVNPEVIGRLGERDYRRLQNMYKATLGNDDSPYESLES